MNNIVDMAFKKNYPLICFFYILEWRNLNVEMRVKQLSGKLWKETYWLTEH